MKNSFNKGQEAVEFVLITVLVFFAALITIVLFGNKIASFFTSDSSVIKNSKSPVAMIDKNAQQKYIPDYQTSVPSDGTIQPGDLGGTPEKPVKQCNNGSCVIDFGKFALSNLPENFNSYIDTAGSSGGTAMLSDFISQISDQLKAQGLNAEADDIKKLSNLGHNLASIEKSIEEKVKACNKDSTCVQGFRYQPLEKPANFNDSIATFPSGRDYDGMVADLAIGYERITYNNDPTVFNEQVQNGHITAVFLNQYENVLKNPNIIDPIKGVLKELYWDIGTIGEDLNDNMAAIYTNYNGPQTTADPLTGSTFSMPGIGGNLFDNLENYKASRISNFDSALICGAGYSSDTGSICH